MGEWDLVLEMDLEAIKVVMGAEIHGVAEVGLGLEDQGLADMGEVIMVVEWVWEEEGSERNPWDLVVVVLEALGPVEDPVIQEALEEVGE